MMNFSFKKAAVIGLSLEGVSTVKYLLKHGVEVFVCDQRKELPKEAKLIGKKIKFQLGKNYLDNLEDFEVVFRTPGMPLWHPVLLRAQKKGVKILSQTKLFFSLCPCPIISVTGTKGKGTTSSLIFEIVKKSGKKVFLGGNIGKPPLDFLDKLDRESLTVLELSSFQLEDLNMSPHIAVVLNIVPDHLASVSYESPNYHRSFDAYLRAKKNIVRFQKEGDFAILNIDSKTSLSFAQETKAQIYFFSRKSLLKQGTYFQNEKLWISSNGKKQFICDRHDVLLRGEHNLENVAAAAIAAFLSGSNRQTIKKGIKSFRGLEHRLELVGKFDGVTYYNDSFSTVPETAIAAINAFSEPIILICGGAEKGLNYQKLGKEITKRNVKSLILIGQISSKIETAVRQAGGKKKLKVIKGVKTMEEAVHKAKKEAERGDVVLLSPASSSFDMFKNYKDRGNQFKFWAKKLNDKKN